MTREDTQQAIEEQAQAQEQHQVEQQAGIQAKYNITNAYEVAASTFQRIGFGPGSGPGGIFGKTDFENARLNAMLDLLESANPEDLESAGKALGAARKALNEAATELMTSVAAVEWKGEAATEFERFGNELAKYTWNLASFANVAGKQMEVASTGLASVRSARPPRDTRADQRKPTEFPPEERTDDNPEYQKAVKVERDRQEAINQMNRLASFYAVSEQTLASQEAPPLPPKLKADVPRPRTLREDPAGSGASPGHVPQGSQTQQATSYGAERGGTAGVPSRTEGIGSMPSTPTLDTSMQIDTVAAPPPQTAPVGPAPSPSAPGPTTSSGPHLPPLVTGLTNPARTPNFRATGTPGQGKTGGPTANAMGRSGTSGGSNSTATGRSGSPVGRAGTTGQPSAVGRSTSTGGGQGRVGGTSGQSPIVGRPSATGQPMAGRAGTAGPTSAGRANGIVGGTPQQRAAGGSSGSRIPRGTVIGGQGAPQGRSSVARPGQAGVIGANQGAGSARPTGRGTPSVNGVVGAPRQGAAPGTARPPRNQSGDREEERNASARPDYLTEDEETWAARRRGAVPPVID
ncbi:hypothetical protein [Streptomyces sp. TRM64462]|uniref:hypothetical protein n=1 Tax=Streptomyces sp. TRM64462 TaxID=2741726 RepID=UPI00158639B1|nr:hypothetical protein [Streptomyces sp. TRM64462]